MGDWRVLGVGRSMIEGLEGHVVEEMWEGGVRPVDGFEYVERSEFGFIDMQDCL